MSNTATDCDSFGSGFRGVSTHRLASGMGLDEERSAALPFSTCTTFQAWSGWFWDRCRSG